MGDDGPMVTGDTGRADLEAQSGEGRDPDRVALLVNRSARSGRAGRYLEQVLSHLADRGIRPDLLEAGIPGESLEAIVASPAGRVLVMGGDGTVHQAASAMADTGRVLGILPTGTGDDTARSLGLTDGGLARQVERALSDPVGIDLLIGAGRPAVTSLVLGFPVDVNRRADAMAVPRGPSRYTLATLIEIPRMRPRGYRLVLDGTVRELTAAVVVVANTAYFGGGMAICPDADPADGLLDVCVVGDVTRTDLLRSFRLVRTGDHVDHPGVSMFRAEEVRLSAAAGGRAGEEMRADGEHMGYLPAVPEGGDAGAGITVTAGRSALLVAGATTSPPGRG